jgi:phosphomannomutase
MDSKSIHFGTDGWRGLLDSEINKESVALVAQAFADYLNLKSPDEPPTCVIGYDTRQYSPEFARIFAEILSGNGILVTLSDRIVPTPVVSFTVKHRNMHAGVMITASHNPSQYNGIKFKASYGGPFFTEETQKVEALLGKSLISHTRENVAVENLLPDYIARLYQLIDFEAIHSSGIRCAVDSMHGAGGSLIKDLLEKNNCPVYGIACEFLPDFGGRTAEPIEKNLEPLKEFLRINTDISVGLATDGDADRLGVLLDGGSWLSAQETILLFADYLIDVKKHPGAIIKTSSVTDKLRLLYETKTQPVYDVQVGFKYIAEKMLEMPVVLGVEESGGFGFGHHTPDRDGIFSALLFLELLAVSGYKKLSDLIRQFRIRHKILHYGRIDYTFDLPGRAHILSNLVKTGLKDINTLPVTGMDTFMGSRGTINGVKIRLKGDCRWLLLRSSETEPMIRIYAEGQTEDEVSLFLNQGIGLIHDFSGVTHE